MATFSAFWALFLQFIVHSSMDCLKLFRRQKPLLLLGNNALNFNQVKTPKHACWKTCCCVYADSSRRQNKHKQTLWFMQRKTSWALGRGIAPSPEIFFRFCVCYMETFSAFWALATWRGGGGHGPPRPPPWIRQWNVHASNEDTVAVFARCENIGLLRNVESPARPAWKTINEVDENWKWMASRSKREQHWH